ncbi:gamma-glutamyl-gamma-aminobutyrate hydrolase family protein [Aciduricibacillus chroicocephali]|uniref:Gamma-glutamyl-gamma-aminobutyrate hydrolase family protein n=1 Tax=Aciduricibacillus chroicocephali TaxID=3054939 RepID=A0ABY9KXH8_9BACI|nr:gamma-glutamyl-gamma-aminobutyrate hydrolase family protein [Bacillaceae bacterium 44XB]
MVPIIGVAGNIETRQGPIFPGIKSAYISNDYIQSVELAGGAPCIMPLTNKQEVITALAERIDGLVLTGGADVNPLLYGEEPHQGLGRISPVRDEFDLSLFRAVHALGKPVLAICRGLQIVNVAFGGTLYQDLGVEPAFYMKHVQQAEPHDATHTVHFTKDSYFSSVFGEKALTNSLHHQAIKEPGEGIIVCGQTEDGVIEAIEADNRSIIGVQWHPEFMSAHDPQLKLFQDLVEKAKQN